MTMRYPLVLTGILDRARRFFPEKEIVSRTLGGLTRYTYAGYYTRVSRLAGALTALGVQRGDRVGTFAWNHHRHLEAYFAVPCMGAVLHTINIRLFPEQLAYIINHAADRVLLVDEDLLPALEQVADQLTTVRHFVVMTDRAELPPTRLRPVHHYEELLAAAHPSFPWPGDLDEWSAAGMCYTSATTGHPKGVVYSHRTIWLHSLMCTGVDTMALGEGDTVMPIVPMFHVNAWGIPFTATLAGARQVLIGPRPDPRLILRFLQEERVTFSAGVPTVWIGVLQALEQEQYDLSHLRQIVCGGAAVPRALIEAFEQRTGVPIIQGYGMTEAAPLTHMSRLKAEMADWPAPDRFAVRARTGLLVPGLEMRLVDEQGLEVPWDGRSMGEVALRGPWVAGYYYNDERSPQTFREDGWYYTGDVGIVDSQGYLSVVDRTRDLVKSGGEWISSVDLENNLMGHPAVVEAAVIGLPHPRWGERPVACVVLRADQRGRVSGEELLDFLRPRFASWWIPDGVIFLDEMPKTGVGKFDKKVLRVRFQHHLDAGDRG